MKESKGNITNILIITKISMMIFIMVIAYMDLSQFYLEIKMINKNRFSIYKSAFFLFLIFMIYAFYKLVTQNIEQYYNVFKLRWLLENIFYMIIISLLDYFFAQYANEYKYIFLLLILSCTIQYGPRYGMITSLLASINVLGNDLIFAPIKDSINMFFQKDVIVTGIFIVIGWVLGYYVDLIAAENQIK